MTIEAKQAVDISYRLEGKKHSLRQTGDGFVNITFSVHPQFVDHRIYSDPMGTRYVIVCVPLNDDETPRVEPASSSSVQADQAPAGEISARFAPQQERRKWNDLPYSTRAAIRADEPTFHDFMGVNTTVMAKEKIRERCEVGSCKEILPGTIYAKLFDEMELEYDTWLKYER